MTAVPTALEAHERDGGHATASQSVLARSAIASYTSPTRIAIPIPTFLSRGQTWASGDLAVLFPNPRGSPGYGEWWMRANTGDWGGGDYRDIMTGTDEVVRLGVADPEKLAFAGWSYGGYMTSWVVSQTSRFKAAMMGAGLPSLLSMAGSNDERVPIGQP